MDLFLLTEDEYNSLDNDVKIESIEYEKNAEVLAKLYSYQSYDRIIVTKRYIDAIGEDRVFNAFKALTLMTNNMLSRLFLLNHRTDTLDKSIVEFSRLGVKPLNIDIKSMTYNQFSSLEEIERADISSYMEDTLPQDILQYTEILKNIEADSLKDYVALHYDKITSTILSCEQIIDKYDSLLSENKSLEAEIQQLKLALNAIKEKYIDEKYCNSILSEKLETARSILLRYIDSIKSYNDAVVTSNISEEFVYRDNQREVVVIYFKEMEDIGFFKVFNEIFENFRNIYNYRAKALVLENSNRRYYDPYKQYKSLGVHPGINELACNDRLVRYGNARKVIEVLTRPSFQLQFLLIYDRSYNMNICAQFKKQITYYLGNHRSNYILADEDIPDDNFISPYEGSYTDIAFLYRDTDNLTDISFKIYCNRNPFVKNLVQLGKILLSEVGMDDHEEVKKVDFDELEIDTDDDWTDDLSKPFDDMEKR